ncbi:MAG: hypothetical protein A2X94_09045 [Bdellovibrionales bacterium GWB1_55_8]|nr:MAG: hypothetical protein A2X94_09045 [Bdellovibrionales bacterium GWB1_55_8]
MKKRILVVDDEPLARTRIRKYLERFPDQYEVREAPDGLAALALLAEFKPRIVFLDIEMPELTGFDVLRNIPGPDRPKIIFQTAFDQFAVRAFEENVCDYLLKPFSDERIQKSLERATENSGGELDKLESHLTREKQFLRNLVVNVGVKQKVILVSDIWCFLSEAHVSKVVLEKLDYACNHSLTYFDENLDPSLFLRIHRNAIVRLDRVASYTNGPNTEVTLANGLVIKASREGARALKQALGSDL